MKSESRVKTMYFTAKCWMALALGVIVAGCATGPTEFQTRALDAGQQQVVDSKPEALQPLYQTLYAEGRRNEVLNLMEIGAEAYHLGYLDEAREALDRAIVDIESVYADNEAARRARSLWYEEAEKDFKGEPYERCMVYFYRGMIYLHDGDYGNARASFISGLLHDAFAEEEQHSADFASLVFLAGWAAQLGGRDRLAREHFEEYREFRPDGPLPDPEHNVLVIGETGTSPRKLGDGVGHYELVYRRGRGFDEQQAALVMPDRELPLYPMEDIYFQASTRGGRQVDRIIEGQVQFRQRTEQTGSTLTAVSQDNLLAGIGASAGGAVTAGFHAITAMGVAAQGISARTNTRADIRYWRRLPDTLHITTLQLEPESGPLRMTFDNERGHPLPELTRPAPVAFDHRGNGVIHVGARAPQ